MGMTGGRSARRETGDLETIPGIGPRMAQDLVDLGFRRVADLAGADPEAMYGELCALRGQRLDRCVLYVFRCAAYFASERVHDPDLLLWWKWKDAPPARRAVPASQRRASRRRPAASAR